MSPLLPLRYSATHVDKHHAVPPDAVDAYEQKLVEQIRSGSPRLQGRNNKPYKLLGVSNKRGVITCASIRRSTRRKCRRRGATTPSYRAGQLRPGAGNRSSAVRRHPSAKSRTARGDQFLELVPGSEGVSARRRSLGRRRCECVTSRNDRRTIKASRQGKTLRPLRGVGC